MKPFAHRVQARSEIIGLVSCNLPVRGVADGYFVQDEARGAHLLPSKCAVKQLRHSLSAGCFVRAFSRSRGGCSGWSARKNRAFWGGRGENTLCIDINDICQGELPCRTFLWVAGRCFANTDFSRYILADINSDLVASITSWLRTDGSRTGFASCLY